MGEQTTNRLLEELKQRRPFRSVADEAIVALLRTTDKVKGDLAELLETRGITPQQYNVLRILRGSHPDPLPTLEIGERMIERQPGITRLLDRLEAKGLVGRQRCPGDRRIVHASITPAGLDLLAALEDPLDQASDLMLSRLSEEELRTLVGLLERVRLGAG